MFQLRLTCVEDARANETAPRQEAPEMPLLSRTQRRVVDDLLDKITTAQTEHALSYADGQRARLEAWAEKRTSAIVRRSAIRMAYELLATLAILLPYCVEEEPASRVKAKKVAGAGKRGAR